MTEEIFLRIMRTFSKTQPRPVAKNCNFKASGKNRIYSQTGESIARRSANRLWATKAFGVQHMQENVSHSTSI